MDLDDVFDPVQVDVIPKETALATPRLDGNDARGAEAFCEIYRVIPHVGTDVEHRRAFGQMSANDGQLLSLIKPPAKVLTLDEIVLIVHNKAKMLVKIFK